MFVSSALVISNSRSFRLVPPAWGGDRARALLVSRDATEPAGDVRPGLHVGAAEGALVVDGLTGGRIDCFRTTADPRCELDILPIRDLALGRDASKQ